MSRTTNAVVEVLSYQTLVKYAKSLCLPGNLKVSGRKRIIVISTGKLSRNTILNGQRAVNIGVKNALFSLAIWGKTPVFEFLLYSRYKTKSISK